MSKNLLKLYKFGGEILKKSVRWTISSKKWMGSFLVDPHRIWGSIKIQGSHLNWLFNMQKLHQLFDLVQNETPGWATTSKLIHQPIHNHFTFKTDTLQPPLEQSGRNAGEIAGEMREKCGGNTGETAVENAGEVREKCERKSRRKCGRNCARNVVENAGSLMTERFIPCQDSNLRILGYTGWPIIICGRCSHVFTWKAWINLKNLWVEFAGRIAPSI